MGEKRVCVFFGHRDAPDTIRPAIEAAVIRLLNESECCFYVGNHGNFDRMVIQTLKHLAQRHAFTYAVAVTDFESAAKMDSHPTVLPEGIEIGPRRFAIDRRNRWMAKKADIVVAYVARDWGGAAKYTAMANRTGATVINLVPSPAISALP